MRMRIGEVGAALLLMAACGGDALERIDGEVAMPDTGGDAPLFDTFAEVDALVPDTTPDASDGAEDTRPDEPADTRGDSDGEGDALACGEAAPFPFFCPCTRNNQCDSGWCVPTDEDEVAMRCSRLCQDTCPEGWECRGAAAGGDPVFLCQPPIDTLCDACVDDADCKEIGARCVTYDDGTFCGRDCEGAPAMCPEGYACEEVTNDVGQVESYQCKPSGGSCVCPDNTDYTSDPANCGVCGHVCAFDGGTAGCEASACVLTGCLDGFQNLDKVEDNGCEYGCAYVGDDDEPDPRCQGSDCDQDCDGIDGSYTRAVFVSATGGDGATGTPYDPLPTIMEGIDKAEELGRPHVYVAAGTYEGEVALRAGVSVFGGYSNDGRWTRDLALHRTILTNPSGTSSVRVVIADGVRGVRTVLDGVDVVAGSNANPGGSSYGMWVRGADANLVVRNVTVVGGNGGPGQDGAAGARGPDGVAGDPGDKGAKNCGDTRAQGGAPGPSQCPGGGVGDVNPTGGEGGDAGCDSFAGSDTDPDWGAPSPGGAGGGNPNNGEGPGDPGGPGVAGEDGRGGGASGEVVQGFWRGSSGGDGRDGGNGVGGGGGAGGEGGINVATGRWGGGGGGGGSGGCGGKAGRGGTGGGGSFGLFLVDASPTLVDVALGHRAGGNGGLGGKGGDLGLGRDGGAGGEPYDSHANGGGKGGKGGDGGRGGHGGGGAGGVAFGLYLVGASDPRCERVSYAPENAGGVGGVGGASADGAGSKGADGAFGDRNQGSPSCP